MKKKYKMFVVFFTMGLMLIGCITFYIGRSSITSQPPTKTNTEVKTEDKPAGPMAEGEQKEDGLKGEQKEDGLKGDMPSSGTLLDEDDKNNIRDGKFVLEENMYPEVNAVVEKYLNASVIADMDTLNTIVSNSSHIDREALIEKYRYVESYENISCYTIKGPEEGGYRVYAYVELKLIGIDTLAPGLSSLYVTQTEEGDYCVYLDVLSSRVQEFIDEADESEPVQKLVEQVNYRFNEALGKNEGLKKLHDQMTVENT